MVWLEHNEGAPALCFKNNGKELAVHRTHVRFVRALRDFHILETFVGLRRSTEDVPKLTRTDEPIAHGGRG